MTRQVVAIIVLASAAVAPAACGSSEPAPAPGGAGVPAPAAATVPLAPPESLAAMLPALDGWTRGEVRSQQISLPAPATNAAASYTRGAARLDLEITDTGGAKEYLEAISRIAGTDFSTEASNGYMKGTTIAGAPAVESWNHVDRLADLTVIIRQRYILHAAGAGVDSLDSVRQLLTAVDTARLR